MAFNFLTVIYAIVAGLLVLSLTTMVAVDFMNIGAIPKTVALVVVLLPVNMLAVSGLKRRKSWAYVICSAQLAFLLAVIVYPMVNSPVNPNGLIVAGLLALLGLILYSDYASSRGEKNTPKYSFTGKQKQ